MTTTASKPAIEGTATIFVVRDLQRSIEHYRDVLGFHVEFIYGQPPFYAGVERDHLLIHLQASEHTKRQPGHGAIYAFTDNVDALYDELKAKGANTPQSPKDYPYGMRDFSITDIDGNQLSFGTQSKSASKT
jgi:uncharacterized glyoxalase superfamily protein PhnB